MIECIFTLDYEIYGNGQGSLRDVVLDPTQRLAEVFQQFDVPFVVFAEAVEFARIEQAQSDPDTAAVRAQLREMRGAGHEIGLHVHPWWARARYERQALAPRLERTKHLRAAVGARRGYRLWGDPLPAREFERSIFYASRIS